MKLTLLGTGASTGVPIIGCDCPTCMSLNPKNQRTRVSALIESSNTSILLDTPPDLRQQALANHVTDIDAIFYTHAHADHVHGIDDIRTFNYRKNKGIATYSDHDTLHEIKQRFDYAFTPPLKEHVWGKPYLIAHEVTAGKSFTIGDITLLPLLQFHGKTPTLGLRINNMAYTIDVNHMPEETLAALEGIDIWVVDCLRYTPSFTHANLEMALEWINKIKPELAILTHMNHDMEYEELMDQLPSGVVAGYDGMVIET